MFVALSVAYPLVVYWAMGRSEPRWLAVLLLVLALLRALSTRPAVWLVAAAGAAVLAALATVFNQALPLKLSLLLPPPKVTPLGAAAPSMAR